MSGNKTVKKQKKKNSNKKKNTPSTIDRAQHLRVVRVRDIMPPRILTDLKYIVLGGLVNATGVTASRQMNANGIYDVDPALASTSVPGFVEFCAFYNRYKVKKVRSVCTFINTELFPVVINLGFEPVPFGANAKTIAYYEMHNQRTMLLPGQQRASPITLSMTKNGMQVVGDDIVNSSINYTGSNSSNPAGLWYTSISATAQSGNVFTAAGLAIRWELHFEVEFFETKNLFA